MSKINKDPIVKLSKFLSLVLRHKPEKIGIELDGNGWTSVDALLVKATKSGHWLNKQLLDKVVEENNKKRFEYSLNGLMIRACQGHSVDIDLNLTPVPPPEILFHGTAREYVPGIKAVGLLKMKRMHVHLSADYETAKAVGSRHGQPFVCVVRAFEMWKAGKTFFKSTNGVWLVESVDEKYISFDFGE